MCCQHPNRREFVGLAAAAALAPAAALAAGSRPVWERDMWDPERPLFTDAKPLKIQPILIYRVSARKYQTSWKSWGGVQTEQSADEESRRIAAELRSIADRAGFQIEAAPVIKVASVEAAAAARNPNADVTIVYPASGSGAILRACIADENRTIIFLRHRSGPIYYWYEALSVRYVRQGRLAAAPANSAEGPYVSADDVVVDDGDDLLWRLRSFYGVRNFPGSRVLALGGATGKYAAEAPRVARDRFKLDIVQASYDDMSQRLQSAFRDQTLMARAAEWAGRYVGMPGITLETDKQFVVNAFLLYGLWKDMMRETNSVAFTIQSCMGTIMPMARTTACLALSLMNDEGLMAFCESDFVIIPAGILLRYISGKPVFLHNSTFPHNAVVTCAHCTSPRRMDGSRYQPARLLTHYESEYGAAPKVEFPKDQPVTCVSPEYATGRWVGIKGVVESNPFYDICRSQQDVRILGDWKRLLGEVRDSHWIMAYGDYLKELAYAAPRVGARWEQISD